MRLLILSLLIPTVISQDSLRERFSSEEDSESLTVPRSRQILHDVLATKRSRREEQPNRNEDKDVKVWIVPPDPKDYETKRMIRAREAVTIQTDAQAVHGDTFRDFDQFTDSRGIMHRPRSRSPFSKPGLWEPNPDNPHNRDHANKYWYHPESVGVDWMNGQLQWGAHWAIPAAGAGGTDGMSTLHFPSIGNFFNIPDDYD